MRKTAMESAYGITQEAPKNFPHNTEQDRIAEELAKEMLDTYAPGWDRWNIVDSATERQLATVFDSEATAALIARAPDLLAENERLKESVDWDVVNALAEKDEYKRELAAFLAENAHLRSRLATLIAVAQSYRNLEIGDDELDTAIEAAQEAIK